MWVYNNGTNVVDAVTHLTSLTLASPLPTASGGTGSNATTFCNLQSNVTGILPNANTTATASNGASTIVARDGVGSFAVNTVTATNVAATTFLTADFSIVQSGTDLLIKNGATTIVTISSSGAISAAGDITSLS